MSYLVGNTFVKDNVTYQILARAGEPNTLFCEYLLGFHTFEKKEGEHPVDVFYAKHQKKSNFISILTDQERHRLIPFNYAIIRNDLFFPIGKEKLIQGILLNY